MKATVYEVVKYAFIFLLINFSVFAFLLVSTVLEDASMSLLMAAVSLVVSLIVFFILLRIAFMVPYLRDFRDKPVSKRTLAIVCLAVVVIAAIWYMTAYIASRT